jgi:excisionase family DNA binding protein
MTEPLVTPWRTVSQAAARAQTGDRMIYREVKAGRLKAARVGGRRELRFKDEWIDQWLEASTTPQEVSRPFNAHRAPEFQSGIGFTAKPAVGRNAAK